MILVLNMVEIIKQAALEANEATKPMAIVFGTVISEKPLQIDIELKQPLDEDFLILTNAVMNYNVSMSVSHQTESSDGHTHNYLGTKAFKVLNGLKKGEKVILLRVQGGQKYIVLDRVVDS